MCLGGGVGVARGVSGGGRLAGPIKKKAACAAGEGVGVPAVCGAPVGSLGQ